jgi:hypothetical protein
MRPNVIEVRHDWSIWMIRADYTGGHWKYVSGFPHDAPFSYLKREIMVANPDYIVEWPEAKGQVWQDA